MEAVGGRSPAHVDEAIAVLRGVVGRFEADHGVRILDPALVAAAQFARRYVTGVQLPKSAVDLIDEAAARVRVEMESVPSEVDAMSRRLEALEIQSVSLENDSDAESVRARAAIVAEMDTLRPKVQATREQWQNELASISEVRRIKRPVLEPVRVSRQKLAIEKMALYRELALSATGITPDVPFPPKPKPPRSWSSRAGGIR